MSTPETPVTIATPTDPPPAAVPAQPTATDRLVSAAPLVLIAVGILQSVLDEATHSNLPDEVINPLKGALTQLMTVHGEEITFGHLESLRVKPRW